MAYSRVNGRARPSQDLLLPPPAECGLPSKFKAWRPRQDEAIVRAAESDRRFTVLCMPTGSGKSLTYMAIAKLTGMRTCVLTSTKGLQKQLHDDFESCGLVDVRGMGNYPCHYLLDEDALQMSAFARSDAAKFPMCDIGPCLGGMRCAYRGGGCAYYDAVAVARRSPLVITNYAYWLNSQPPAEAGDREQGLGKFDLLVLDEAHDAPEQLSNYLSVTVTRNQTQSLLEVDWPREHDDWDEWQEWAHTASSNAGRRASLLERTVKAGGADRKMLRQYKELRNLADDLGRVGGSKGEWVCHMARRGDRGLLTLHFDPVWPGEYAEKELFRDVARVILTSATVRPKTMELLGVAAAETDFDEYPSTFPVERRPVYWLPTVRMDSRTDPSYMRLWVNKIDNIIRARLDRKGIIHTVSYARRDFILRHSEFASRMMVHETATARDVVERFKKAGPGTVLVSPSMTTGWDFPYDECRYQIIGKVPFPDSRDKIIKARSAVDPEYAYYITMQTLQQESGRGMREFDDLCETFIIDDNVSWFLGKWGSKLAARWFMQAYKRWPGGIPEAPKL